MSHKYVNAVKTLRVGNPTGKAVLWCLADLAGDDGLCRYSEVRIAEFSELAISTVRKWLTELEKGGFIERVKVRKKVDHGWSVTYYQMRFDAAKLPPPGGGKSPPPGRANPGQIPPPRSKTPLRGSKLPPPGRGTYKEETYKNVKDNSLGESGGETPTAPKRPSDPRAEHPAILAICSATNRYPHKVVWDHLIDRLGEEVDPLKLRRAAQAWIARGHNPTNYDGIIDWYEKGIPDKGKNYGTGSKNTRRTDQDVIAESAEFYENYPAANG